MADESAKSLATCAEFEVSLEAGVCVFPAPSNGCMSNGRKRRERSAEGGPEGKKKMKTYFGNTANVFIAVLFGEAQVLVEAEAHVVAVQAVGRDAQVQQVLLEGRGDGRLAGRGEARQPEGDAALAAELGALGAGEGRVPGNVAGRGGVICRVRLWYTSLLVIVCMSLAIGGVGGAAGFNLRSHCEGRFVIMKRKDEGGAEDEGIETIREEKTGYWTLCAWRCKAVLWVWASYCVMDRWSDVVVVGLSDGVR